MNNFLLYILNSTICLSLLYLLFRSLMRKETNFKLNRIVLLSLIVSSLIIPKLILPYNIQKPVEIEMLPVFTANDEKLPEYQFSEKSEPVKNLTSQEKQVPKFRISARDILLYGYLAGIVISVLILIYGIFSIIILYRKAEVKRMEGYRLVIVKKQIPAFSLGRIVFISHLDYENHHDVILTHEKEHIRLNHFYDLIFLESVKIFHWFNPFIYWLIRDMKDIHEFQADHLTINKGIDSKEYKLLIIQKGVGPERFALANSFNHCQIGNRIDMINKLKTRKAWHWKVAAFLPLLVLLLIFCGRKGNNVPSDQNKQVNQLDMVIFGKRLIVKDTTQYASSFIKELKESYMGYEKLIVKDDSFLITSRSNQGVFPYKYNIPISLELNRETIFSTKSKDRSLVLKRTNYTDLEYQVKNEKKETISSGTAVLQVTFFLGAEMDHDENGNETESYQYIDTDSGGALIKVEIYHAGFASITYLNRKANKLETLYPLLRE